MANEDPNSLGLAVDLSELSADLTAVTAEIEAALRDTGEVIAQELKSAARSGEADFSAMARSIAEELASIALQRVFSRERSSCGAERSIDAECSHAAGSVSAIQSVRRRFSERRRLLSLLRRCCVGGDSHEWVS